LVWNFYAHCYFAIQFECVAIALPLAKIHLPYNKFAVVDEQNRYKWG
jgi:hypothetical protein